MATKRQIGELLRRITQGAGVEFSGIGIVISSDPMSLPIFPLRSAPEDLLARLTAEELLSSISRRDSKFHDGFHILRPDLTVDLVAQYFSPPISRVKLDSSLAVGGRYMAAIFGSMLQSVELSAVVGIDRRLAVFERGVEVLSEDLT